MSNAFEWWAITHQWLNQLWESSRNSCNWLSCRADVMRPQQVLVINRVLSVGAFHLCFCFSFSSLTTAFSLLYISFHLCISVSRRMSLLFFFLNAYTESVSLCHFCLKTTKCQIDMHMFDYINCTATAAYDKTRPYTYSVNYKEKFSRAYTYWAFNVSSSSSSSAAAAAAAVSIYAVLLSRRTAALHDKSTMQHT